MESILILFTSFLTFFSGQVKFLFSGQKNPSPTPIAIISTTPTTEDIVTQSPPSKYTATPSSTTQPVVTLVNIKTPTNTISTDGQYNYVITIRPGENIRVTTISPMKGVSTVSVELPPSGAPAGVYFTQDQANDRNIFLHVNSSAQPGKYTWRQSFKAVYSTGTAPGELSMGIQLTILPPL